MNKNQRVSFETGTVSLMCIGLFFMCQIVKADAAVTDAYENGTVVSSSSSQYTETTTTTTVTDGTAPVTTTTTTTTSETTGDPALSAEIIPNLISSVSRGAKDVQLIAIKLTNTGTGNLTLSEITIPGNYAVKNESNTVLAIEGSSTTEVPDVVSEAKATFSGLNIQIPAASAVTLTLKGDIAATNVKTAMVYNINASNLVVKSGEGEQAKITVSGTNSTLKIQKSAATLTASVEANTATSVAKGATLVQLIAVKFTNTGSEDTVLNRIEIAGNFAAADIANAKLFSGDTEIATPYSTKYSRVSFKDLSINVAKGGSVIVSLKGDVLAKSAKSSLSYNIESCCLARAKGVSGATAKIAVTRGKSTLTLTAAGETVTPTVQTGTEDKKDVIATVTDASTIKDGALIRLKGSIDVYIVKISGTEKYKRLIVSPTVFKSYKHLKWTDIIEVDQATFDAFTTSELVRVAGSNKVFKLEASGDTGKKTEVTSTTEYRTSSVYEVNQTDFNSSK